MRIVGFFVLFLLAAIAPAGAQQRPLVTEDPETIGAGNVLLEAGVDAWRGVVYPVSGLEGNLLRLPALGISFGVGSIVELQLDGGFYNRLIVTSRRAAPLGHLVRLTGDRTTDVEDLVVGTKIRLASEGPGRPAFAIRLATQLPNAGNESGLGLDTMNFFASLLVGKTVQSVRIVGNAGLGILGDPVGGNQQGDVLLYGVSLARAVRQGLEVVGEVNGRYSPTEPQATPPGTDSRAAMRFGARFTQGTVRLDGGVIIGMTARDPSFGVTGGLTWVFRAFNVPQP